MTLSSYAVPVIVLWESQEGGSSTAGMGGLWAGKFIEVNAGIFWAIGDSQITIYNVLSHVFPMIFPFKSNPLIFGDFPGFIKPRCSTAKPCRAVPSRAKVPLAACFSFSRRKTSFSLIFSIVGFKPLNFCERRRVKLYYLYSWLSPFFERWVQVLLTKLTYEY